MRAYALTGALTCRDGGGRWVFPSVTFHFSLETELKAYCSARIGLSLSPSVEVKGVCGCVLLL